MSSNALPLSVDLDFVLGTLHLSATFQANAPWTVLFGPSGSGKSTILRAIAGFLPRSAGRVTLLGRVVQDIGVWVPAHQREIRWAGQKAALFPRRTVRQNTAMAMDPREHSPDDLELFLDIFGLHAIAAKTPAQLSGGQRQLVSVARAAIGARRRILLLDEPFSGLDAATRERLIDSLRRWLGDTPVLSVTHDVGEAFYLDADVIRIAQGRIVAQGAVQDVLAPERASLRQILG